MRDGIVVRWHLVGLLVAIVSAVDCTGGKSSSESPAEPECVVEPDRTQRQDQGTECKTCEKTHRGVAPVEVDCRAGMPKPVK